MEVLLEYVWLDAIGVPRSKTRVIHAVPASGDGPTPRHPLVHACLGPGGEIDLGKLPAWDYDGSSTGQADGGDSEVILRPRALFVDPFRPPDRNTGRMARLVLCDTCLPDGEPHPTNTRAAAEAVFRRGESHSPWFAVEQEFFISRGGRPVGLPGKDDDPPAPQGPYYCGVGGRTAIGRACVERALGRALRAGLSVTGMNAEVAPSQWEIQVCAPGIACADEVVVLRYILARTAEEEACDVSFEPKPVPGDWNGSGGHVNFSTAEMREEGGYEAVTAAVDKLRLRHMEHMAVYGKGNEARMTGQHETADYNTFSSGVADRGASVRIPRATEKNGCGYLEDRRPAANMDPYVVTSMILDTTCLSSAPCDDKGEPPPKADAQDRTSSGD